MNKIESKESCERLAGAICSDIMLYQEKDVQQVKRGAPMSPELNEAIAQGRELYLSRTAPEFADLFDESLLKLVGIAPNTPLAVADTGRPPEDANRSPIQHDRRPAYEETSVFKTTIFLLLAAVVAALVIYVLFVR